MSKPSSGLHLRIKGTGPKLPAPHAITLNAGHRFLRGWTGKILLHFFASVLPNYSFATDIPSHFASTIGAVITCRSQVRQDHMNDYMHTFFGEPIMSDGGANWWKVDAKLFSGTVAYIFVSNTEGKDFVGATFNEDAKSLVDLLAKTEGIKFTEDGFEKWKSPGFSIILKLNDTTVHSKMYCWSISQLK